MAKLGNSIINGTLQVSGATTLDIPLPISCGGTGATTAADARTNLEITPANIGAAASSHNHDASNITSGTLPIARGGTGATTAASAISNLGMAGYIKDIGITGNWRYIKFSNNTYLAFCNFGTTLTGFTFGSTIKVAYKSVNVSIPSFSKSVIYASYEFYNTVSACPCSTLSGTNFYIILHRDSTISSLSGNIVGMLYGTY